MKNLLYICIFIILCSTVKANEFSVILFSAPSWCAPCRMFHSQVWVAPEVVTEMQNCDTYVVDIDRAPNIARQYGVGSVPCLVIVRNLNNKERTAIVLEKKVGFQPVRDFIKWIRTNKQKR